MRKSLAQLTLAEAIFKREWNRIREAFDGLPHDLTDQYELQRMAASLLQLARRRRRRAPGSRQEHLLLQQDLAHMVLSLKPFGCMPSTQSDGAQSAVVNLYKDMIYLPIETSGEGEINATAACRWRSARRR